MGLMTFRRLREREEENHVQQESEGNTADVSTGGDTGTDEGNGADTGNEAGNEVTEGDNATGTEGGDEGTPGNASGHGDVTQSEPKLTQEEYNEIIRNKDNVMKELEKRGIYYSKTEKADDLRDTLNFALNELGVLPDGN